MTLLARLKGLLRRRRRVNAAPLPGSNTNRTSANRTSANRTNRNRTNTNRNHSPTTTPPARRNTPPKPAARPQLARASAPAAAESNLARLLRTTKYTERQLRADYEKKLSRKLRDAEVAVERHNVQLGRLRARPDLARLVQEAERNRANAQRVANQIRAQLNEARRGVWMPRAVRYEPGRLQMVGPALELSRRLTRSFAERNRLLGEESLNRHHVVHGNRVGRAQTALGALLKGNRAVEENEVALLLNELQRVAGKRSTPFQWERELLQHRGLVEARVAETPVRPSTVAGKGGRNNQRRRPSPNTVFEKLYSSKNNDENNAALRALRQLSDDDVRGMTEFALAERGTDPEWQPLDKVLATLQREMQRRRAVHIELWDEQAAVRAARQLSDADLRDMMESMLAERGTDPGWQPLDMVLATLHQEMQRRDPFVNNS